MLARPPGRLPDDVGSTPRVGSGPADRVDDGQGRPGRFLLRHVGATGQAQRHRHPPLPEREPVEAAPGGR
jgi:hypothetical protein